MARLHPPTPETVAGNNSAAGAAPAPMRPSQRLQVAVVVVVAGLVRLVAGLLQPPEADEATLGVAALRITHGHLILMETNAHYLGALGAYIAAPFVAILGSGTPALRLAMSLVGAGYVGVMYALGRAVFGGHAGGLRSAVIAAVFPLFAVLFPVRALWAYGEILPIGALLLLLTIRIAWLDHRRRRDWVGLGLVAGVGMWTTPLLAVVLVPCALALLIRAPLLGWMRVLRGTGLTLVGAVTGYLPWLVYTVAHRGASLHGLAGARVGRLTAARQVLNAALPIFTGAVRTCGSARTVWTVVPTAGVALLVAVVLAPRLRDLLAVCRGVVGATRPLDLVLLIVPLSLASVILSGFNGVSCEPRYLLPLALPLVLCAAAALSQRPLPVSALLTAWLVVEAVTLVRTPRVGAATSTGVSVPTDVGQAAAVLERRHLEAIYADYWLERPILYASGARLVMGEYNGFVGFPGIQAAADRVEHPSWLFVAGDPTRLTLEAACRTRGVVYQRSELNGLILYAGLSHPVRPTDLHLVVDQSRYPLVPASEDVAGPDR